jgi:capsular polysaccharide biosynthesis protein
MDTNQNIVQNSKEEVGINDIIMTLWRQKIVIISITMITAILAGIISIFVLSPVYQSKLHIVINMPQIFTTRYGEYELPITTNQQYINLIESNDVLYKTISDMGYGNGEVALEDLQEKIAINAPTTTADTEQNNYEVIITSDNPQKALKLSEVLYDNYLGFLDAMIKEREVIYFYDSYSVKLKTLETTLESKKEILKNNEELLTTAPQTINQKAALGEVDKLNTNDYVVLENVINPNYTQIENDIIVNKQSINEDENMIKVYNKYLDELNAEKEAINKYKETGKIDTLGTSIESVVNSSVYLPSQPAAPTRKTSPSNTRNVIIGGLLGGMMGVLVALTRKYLFNKA